MHILPFKIMNMINKALLLLFSDTTLHPFDSLKLSVNVGDVPSFLRGTYCDLDILILDIYVYLYYCQSKQIFVRLFEYFLRREEYFVSLVIRHAVI